MPTATTKQRVRKKKDNSDEQALLFIIFWVSVIAESIALYKRQYVVYAVARMLVVPILLLRIFRSPAFRNVGAYFYLFLLLSLAADASTAFGNYRVACIGHSLYALSYLCLGCYFQQLNNKSSVGTNVIFVSSLLLLATINTLWIYAPELHKQTFFGHLAVHVVVLLFAIYGAVSISQKAGNDIPTLFLLGVAAIIFTNILYGLDILRYHQTYSWMDALVSVGDGIYLFLLTRGVLLFAKRTQKLTTESIS